MGKQKTGSPELLELCAHMAQWRQENGGGRGSRIPEELWQEALVVSRKDGVWTTAQAAHLNYLRLRERSRQAAKEKIPVAVGGNERRAQVVRARGKKQDLVAGAGARFVTLQMTAEPPASGATVEFLSHNGDRIRVEVAGAVDMVGLAHAFWGRSS